MAKLLKGAANLFMGAILVRGVGRDLALEVRDDAARSPYAAALAATLLGLAAGVLLVRHRRERGATTDPLLGLQRSARGRRAP